MTDTETREAPEQLSEPQVGEWASPDTLPDWLDPEKWVGRVPAELVVVDGQSGYQCPWPDCSVIRPTLSGVTLHRNRTHVSERLKALRRDRQTESYRLGKAKAAAEQALVAPPSIDHSEAPAVLAYLNETRDWQSTEYDAYRKRLSRAKHSGISLAVFERQELERAIGIVFASEPLNGASKAAITKAATAKATPTPKAKPVKKAPTHAEVDDLFERIGLATKLLFNGEPPWDRIIEVAEWQKMTIAMLQG